MNHRKLKFIAVMPATAALCAFTLCVLPSSTRAAQTATEPTLEMGYAELSAELLSRRTANGCDHCRRGAYQALLAERSLAVQASRALIDKFGKDSGTVLKGALLYIPAWVKYDHIISGLEAALIFGWDITQPYYREKFIAATAVATDFFKYAAEKTGHPFEGARSSLTDAQLQDWLGVLQSEYRKASTDAREKIKAELMAFAWPEFGDAKMRMMEELN